MTHLPRRAVLASTAALIAGCTASETQPTDSETPRESSTTTPNTETPTQTPEPPLAVPEPDLTIQYGETFVDAGLAITVERPTIKTTFAYEGPRHETPLPSPTPQPESDERFYRGAALGSSRAADVFEMPDGEALALAPITYENTHEERRRVSGPSFILRWDETAVMEVRAFEHPEFDSGVKLDDLKGLGRGYGWFSIEGDAILSEQRVQTHAMFVVPDDTDPADCDVSYKPGLGIPFEYYGDEIVTWTATE